jgi:hypothetical protein
MADADKVAGMVEKLAKDHTWDRGDVSVAESTEKPTEAAKVLMSDLAKLCFTSGVNMDGAHRSRFFALFNEEAQLTPYFRWCSQQVPPVQYKFMSDTWYRIFASKVDGKKRCKEQDHTPAPAAAAVQVAVQGVQHQYAQPYFPSEPCNVPPAWEAALRAENTTLTERLSQLERTSALQSAQLQRQELRMKQLEAANPKPKKMKVVTKRASASATKDLVKVSSAVAVGYSLLQSVAVCLQSVTVCLQSVTVCLQSVSVTRWPFSQQYQPFEWPPTDASAPPFKNLENLTDGWIIADEPLLFIRLSKIKGYVLCAREAIATGIMFARVDIADLRHVPDEVPPHIDDAVPFSEAVLIAAYGDYICCKHTWFTAW